MASRLNPRRRSEIFQRSLSNASWNSVDYLVFPVLLLVVTPYLVRRLGLEQFGLWALVSALTGMMGVFGFGLGDATIKYVSAYRARGDWEGVCRVVRSTLSCYLVLGVVTSAFIYFAARALVQHVFTVPPAIHELAVAAIRIGAVGLAVRFLNGVLTAVVQGCERYDLSARTSMIVKILSVVVTVALAAAGYGVCEILWATVVLTGAGAVALAFVARTLVPGITFWPLFEPEAIREVFGFGVYSWLQGIASTVFAQADLILVGILLGTTSVAYYSVCQRLAMQIHALPAAGCSFLFPLTSAATAVGKGEELRRAYLRSLNLVVLVAAVLGVPLFLFSDSILTLWMGKEFAQQTAALLKILAFGYALLATSTVPYNVLNGSGHVRVNTLLSWASVLVVVVATVGLAPTFGLAGVAWAKLANIVPLVAAMVYIQRKVLLERRWVLILAQFIPILLPFGVAFLGTWAYGDPRSNNLLALSALMIGCVAFTIGLAAILQRIFRLIAVPSSSSVL